MTEDDIRRVLNEVEKRELPLLTWGVTNGTLNEPELEDLVQKVATGADVDDMLDALIDRGLIVAKGLAEERYRSRMAETVRLATSLRQWFHGRDWRTAPPLVSDARFVSQPRVVPQRTTSATELSAIARAALDTDWTERHDAAMHAVLAGRSVSAFQARALTRVAQHHAGPKGTVITAGTGSGKTLAFYLPVLTELLAYGPSSRDSTDDRHLPADRTAPRPAANLAAPLSHSRRRWARRSHGRSPLRSRATRPPRRTRGPWARMEAARQRSALPDPGLSRARVRGRLRLADIRRRRRRVGLRPMRQPPHWRPAPLHT